MLEKRVYVLPLETINPKLRTPSLFPPMKYIVIARNKIEAVLSVGKNLVGNLRLPEGEKITRSSLDKYPFATEKGVLLT